MIWKGRGIAFWILRILLNRLFVYSAGRAIVSRDAPTTQICSTTALNTQKPTPTKEAAFGRHHKWGQAPSAHAPFVDSFAGVVFLAFWAVGLHICVVGASLDTIALPAE